MSLLVLAVAFAGAAQSRPPTLDPTYGRPIPKNALTPKLPPDAKWIWANETQDTQSVTADKTFHVDKQPATAMLYVAVDNYMVLLLDGKTLGQTVAGSDDMSWTHVQKFDVGSSLTPGDHTIEIKGTNAGGPAGIVARLQADGKPIVVTDKSWQITDMGVNPATTGPATEEAILGEGAWGGQLTGWPVPLASVPNYLHHLPMPAVAIALAPDNADPDNLDWHKSNGAVDMGSPTPGKPWKVVFDFSRELSGRAVLDQSAGLSGSVGCGESIGEATQKPYTSASFGPGDKETDTPYSASRYACVSFPASVSHASFHIGFDHLYYPVTYRGSFDSSDPLMNSIWYTGAYTAHLCMQQDIWDAPKRDRARWMGDLHVSGEVINNAFLDKFLMEQTMSRLRADAQGSKPDGQQPGSHVNGIPGYSCAWLAGLDDFYLHTGDLDYIKSQHDAILSMIEFMKGEIGPDGTFADLHGEWDYVDWSPDFDKDTPQTRATTHFFFIKAAKSAADLLGALGDNDNAAKCSAWAEELTRAAQAHLVREHSTFGDRRQENSMAIFSGATTQLENQAIYQQVLNLGSPSWKQIATPYYNNYVIAALSELGHDDDVANFVRSYWGGMIQEGATTFWEGYDTSWDKHNAHIHLGADDGYGYFVSLCHGWSAGVTNWLTESVLGVKPSTGGFKTCLITPHLIKLKWISGSVPTPSGVIKVRFEQDGSRVKGTVSIPVGTTARLQLDGYPSLTVDGQKSAGTFSELTTGTHQIVASLN
jgi:alpha-L-rhamnosidase